MIYTSLTNLIHLHTHTHTHTHMFASIIITTPQGSIILCLIYENNELSINAKSPIFQCVKSIHILSFSVRYFTALFRTEYGDLSNTAPFYRLFLELQNYSCC